jgi:hypothetical protein
MVQRLQYVKENGKEIKRKVGFIYFSDENKIVWEAKRIDGGNQLTKPRRVGIAIPIPKYQWGDPTGSVWDLLKESRRKSDLKFKNKKK